MAQPNAPAQLQATLSRQRQNKKNLSHLVSGARWLSRNRVISSAEFPIRRESRDRRGYEKVESAPQALSFDWLEWYDEGQAVSGSPLLAKVKSVGELDKEIAEKDKQIPDPTNVVTLKAKAVKEGEW